MFKQTNRRIMAEICRVLWEQWDPIGVNDEPDAFGEYDGYAGSLYGLLLRDASEEEIDQQLYTYETDNMGLRSLDKKERLAVVKSLRAIDLDPPDAP